MPNNKEPKENQSTIILFVQGGAGDVLAHSPMIRAMRKQYPEDFIIVLSTYAQLWENNPNIDKVLALSNPDPRDFFTQYIWKKNVRFIRKRFVYDYLFELEEKALGALCLPDFICRCYGMSYDEKPLDYFISEYEHRCAKTFMTQTKNKKILLHTTGAVPSENYGKAICGLCGGKGVDPDGNKCRNCNGTGSIVLREKTNNLKDLRKESIAPVVEKYAKKGGYDFLQIGLDGEEVIPGAIDCLGMSMRETAALIHYCDSFIFIESLFMHIANALGKSGVVVGQSTDMSFFGYENQYNISYAGKCPDHPCNRLIGPLPDYFPGYIDPKKKNPVSWDCKDQECAKIPPKLIEQEFLKSLKGPPRKDDGFNSLEEAINTEDGKEVVEIKSIEQTPLRLEDGVLKVGNEAVDLEDDKENGKD